MTNRIVVDCKTGGVLVETLGVADDAALELERAPLVAQQQAEDAVNATAATTRERVAARLDELRTGADALEAGTLTPQQQRVLLALTIRTVLRLARLVLRRLDALD